MRINRYLSRCGVASRRKAEELIANGSVFVNGIITKELGADITPKVDKVTINGKDIRLPELKYYLFNKPKGYTVTKKDRHAKHTIYEFIPKNNSLFSVGRLDKDTTGLLIITNDGDFAQNMIHPSKKIPKEYEVTLKRPTKAEDCNKLLSGIRLSDGPAKAVSVKQIADNKLILTILEGRKRIVKRMAEAIGNEVIDLNRSRIGEIVLDVPVGKYRELTEKEVSKYV